MMPPFIRPVRSRLPSIATHFGPRRDLSDSVGLHPLRVWRGVAVLEGCGGSVIVMVSWGYGCEGSALPSLALLCLCASWSRLDSSMIPGPGLPGCTSWGLSPVLKVRARDTFRAGVCVRPCQAVPGGLPGGQVGPWQVGQVAECMAT